MTVPALQFKREELIEALEARRSWARRLDSKNLAEHRRAEKDALRKFRDRLREAMKWDYETAKKNYFSIRSSDRPYCPASVEAQLERNLAAVKASRQTRYSISDSGSSATLHYLLTHDETIQPDLCA